MYVNTETLEQVSRRQIKQQHPDVSLPKEPTDDQLEPLGFAILHPTEQPEGDVVTQGAPELSDGKWQQTWISRDFTPEELDEQLEQRKQERAGEIDGARDDAFDAGLPYDIAGEPDVVQTRLQDKINLLGLRMEAEGLHAAGVNDAVMPFRGLNNVQRMLTPSEMIALTNAALGHVQAIYQQGWQLKDAVDAAETIPDLDAIEWPPAS